MTKIEGYYDIEVEYSEMGYVLSDDNETVIKKEVTKRTMLRSIHYAMPTFVSIEDALRYINDWWPDREYNYKIVKIK